MGGHGTGRDGKSTCLLGDLFAMLYGLFLALIILVITVAMLVAFFFIRV